MRKDGKKDRRHPVQEHLRYPWTADRQILAITLWLQGRSIGYINKALGVISQKEQGKHFNLEGKAVETLVYKLAIHYQRPNGKLQYPLYDKMPSEIFVGNRALAQIRWKRILDGMRTHNIDVEYAIRVFGGSIEKWKRLLYKKKKDLFGRTSNEQSK